MSSSAMMTRVVNAVTAAQIAQGQPLLYPPLLEFIILQALTELSTDVGVDATVQAAFVAVIAACLTDPAP